MLGINSILGVPVASCQLFCDTSLYFSTAVDGKIAFWLQYLELPLEKNHNTAILPIEYPVLIKHLWVQLYNSTIMSGL